MASAPYIGYADGILNGEIYGWALNKSAAGTPVIVSLYIDAVWAAGALACYYRPDVAQALACSGSNGFYFDLDALCPPGDRAVPVDVRLPGGASLSGSPLTYTRAARATQSVLPTVLFLHIPKTAGTAFREVVTQNYKESQTAYIYGDPPGFPSPSLRDIPRTQRERLRLVFGHYGYGVHCDMPNECRYATLLRRPAARIWSQYEHLRRANAGEVMRSGKIISLEQTLAEKQCVHLDNLYVRYLCGLEESVLPPGAINREIYELALTNARRPGVYIGCQDDLNQAYDAMARELGWKAGSKCPRLNASPTPGLRPSEAQEAAMRESNLWDFKLYEQLAGSSKEKQRPGTSAA